MTPFETQMLPIRVIFGAGSLDRIGAEVAALGVDRVLVIASPSNTDAASRAIAQLEQRAVARFDRVRQHVPESVVAECVATATDAAADGLLTVGGGSATGLGKAVALELGLPLVAVPTTYAGSEMTAIYGVTGEHKRTGRDLRAAPKLVVYDPELTVALPSSIAAVSGGNALAHAVEAVWTPSVSPLAAKVSEQAVRLLAGALPRVVDTPEDLDARSDALYGAHLAGLALSWAGIGIHHKLCHLLGGTFGLGHAEVHTVLLPHVTAFVAPAVSGALAPIAEALAADDAAQGLQVLFDGLGVTMNLRDLGMSEGSLDAAADLAVAAVGEHSPRPVDAAALRVLLGDAYVGRPPRTV